MTELEQFAALRTWLLAVTGLPEIIRAHPSGARPAGVYGMLNLIRAERVNWPDDLEYEAGGGGQSFDEVPVETWAWTWSFHAYGAGGADPMSRVTSAAKSSGALLSLWPLTLHETSAIRRLPELINEVWEERAQMDLTVHGLVRHGFPVDVAEGVTVTAESTTGSPSGSFTISPST